jgi:hypothetical protein
LLFFCPFCLQNCQEGIFREKQRQIKTHNLAPHSAKLVAGGGKIKLSGSVSAERLELSTNGLKGRCSAIELRARACEDGFYHHLPRASIQVFRSDLAWNTFFEMPIFFFTNGKIHKKYFMVPKEKK